MKKINLKGISEILSEKELKNVMGGSSFCTCSGAWGSPCSCPGYSGKCIFTVLGGMYCSPNSN